MVKLTSLRINTALIGPAGCGKTYLAEKVAEALDLRFGSISCTAGMSENQLFGWLLPIADSGKFVYVPAQFVDFYENGGVFLFDEFDNCDENTIGIINQAIANGQFCVPQRYENPVVKKHDDFVCIFALNTYGNGADMTYVGRTQLDGATVDRFRFGRVEMDYSRKVENRLVQPDLLEWAREIRKEIKKNKLQKILSTRYLIDATKWYETYKGDDEDSQKRCLEEIKNGFFMDWTPDEKRRVEAA